MAWVYLRLPETLHEEYRRPFNLKSIYEGFGIVFASRVSIFYIIATALLFGALMGFLNSSQQIYVETYGVGSWFPIYFAAGAAFSAVAGFVNSRVVSMYGMRRIAYTMLAVFSAGAVAMLVLGLSDLLPVLMFFVLAAVIFFSFSMIMPNLGAMAMEPLGEVAGTAASAQGFLQMVLGAAIGAVIGQFYDGSAVPLAAGATVIALLSAVCVKLARK
jgi:MFS transporter, DHA1 family, multidrug resistance protein